MISFSANALPFPGLRPRAKISTVETDDFRIQNSDTRKMSVVNYGEYSMIDARIKTKPLNRHMSNGTTKSRKYSTSFNNNNSSEGKEEKMNINETTDIDYGSIEEEGEIKGDAIVIELDNRDLSVEKKGKGRSVNSSENDGYESSNQAHSDQSRNSNDTISKQHLRDSIILDIESQISDFPHRKLSHRNNELRRTTRY